MHWEKMYATGQTYKVIEGDAVADSVTDAQLAQLATELDISQISYQFDAAGGLIKTIDSKSNETVIKNINQDTHSYRMNL